LKKVFIAIIVMVAVLSIAGTGSWALLNDTETASATFTAGIWGPQNVLIDIKPDDATNTINPESNGVIKVAVLTTSDFDATYVDADRVWFGPLKAVPERWEITDIDNNLSLDMVLTFRTEDTGIRNGDTTVELIGFTLQNRDFKGVDAVRTVPFRDDE
jgi:predicted ribosomally synthesized peptide with SipW-like signal peptide